MNVDHNPWTVSLKYILILSPTYAWVVGRDSSVGIATRYGLDGSEIESRWRWDFPHPSRPALRPTQPPIQWVPGPSRGYSGWGVALTTHHLAEVKERVELYIYSPFGPSWPVLGWTLPLPLRLGLPRALLPKLLRTKSCTNFSPVPTR